MRRSTPRSPLHDKLGDRLHEVAGIVCLVHPWNFMTLREGVPADTLRARVSMRYCVAAALRFGALGSSQFTDEALGDPLVQKFMTLIEIRQADDLPDNGLFPAAVEVRLADGHSAHVRCDIPPGAPAMPMSEAEAEQKYRSCASVVLDASAIERTRANDIWASTASPMSASSASRSREEGGHDPVTTGS